MTIDEAKAIIESAVAEVIAAGFDVWGYEDETISIAEPYIPYKGYYKALRVIHYNIIDLTPNESENK